MGDERTVHVVDDDAAVRRSLQWLLDSEGFSVVAYDTPFAFLDAAPRLSGGCILLDVRMPGMDGLAVQQRLARGRINFPGILITRPGDVQNPVRAVEAGARAFTEKSLHEDASPYA